MCVHVCVNCSYNYCNEGLYNLTETILNDGDDSKEEAPTPQTDMLTIDQTENVTVHDDNTIDATKEEKEIPDQIQPEGHQYEPFPPAVVKEESHQYESVPPAAVVKEECASVNEKTVPESSVVAIEADKENLAGEVKKEESPPSIIKVVGEEKEMGAGEGKEMGENEGISSIINPPLSDGDAIVLDPPSKLAMDMDDDTSNTFNELEAIIASLK